MNKEKISLFTNLKFSAVEKINSNFLRAKCYVLALGKNVNKSYFEKENVDKAYPTLTYAPLIGHLMFDDNGVAHLGGHDMKLDLNDFKLKSQCVPFGVAIPSPEPVYEDVVEADGTTATYLTCEVVIWIGRYPELADAFYSEDIFTGQSMEIYFDKYEPLAEDPTYSNIIDFSFDALCMLQKSDDEKFHVQPAFPSASVVPITYSIDKTEFSLLMNDMKKELSLYFSSEQGGKELDKKLEILQKFGKAVSDLDFSIDDISVEDLESKMNELFGEKKSEPVTFSATYRQKREALANALDPIIVKDSNGNYVEETYFYVEDFDDTHVFVEMDHWTANDYECKYGRYAYTFDTETLSATLTSDFEEMVKMWLTIEEKNALEAERANYTSIEKEFSDYKAEHSFLDSEFNVLKEFKETTEKENRKTNEDALFAKYETLIGESADFATLKENAANYSIEDLDKECLCIVGKFSLLNKKTTEPSTEKKTLKFSLDNPEATPDDEPYGGLIKHYLNK